MQVSRNPTQIIIVSNRGPFTFSVRHGEPHIVRGAGGLVTAIRSVAGKHSILWISCALGAGDRAWLSKMGDDVQAVDDLCIRLAQTDPNEYHAYYNVISNPLLWFIQHQMYDTPRKPLFDEAMWKAWDKGYRAVNQQLAQTVAD